MPITHITTMKSSPLDYHQDLSKNNPWALWEKKVLAGRGEHRDIAVQRLQHCLENNTTTLDLSFLNLTELPDNLPACLILDVSFNRLSHLPDGLPTMLIELHTICNPLRSLPDNLPDSLQILNLRANELTHLPLSLPYSLKELYVSGNRLIDFPETIPPSLAILDIKENLFPPPVLRSIFNTRYDLVSEDFLSTDFIKKIKLWTQNNLKEWASIQFEDNTYNFSDFLQKLHQGKNSYNIELKKRVETWLDYLAQEENGLVREHTFLIAQEATESCVDRASFYFNKMHIAMIENELSKPHVPLQRLIQTNLGLFRMQILEKIATDYIKKAPGIYEEIEIYLMYQHKLRNKLSLPIYTKLEFEWNITPNELNLAFKEVKVQEKTHFLRYLLMESSSWDKRLERWNKDAKKRSEDAYLDEISAQTFEEKIDAVLHQQHISTQDSDARRALGKKLCDDLLYERRYHLTRAFLMENDALALIEKYDERIPKKKGLMSIVRHKFL